MTHAMLVEAAAKWLRKQCPVVITELVTTGEIPDAIGWQRGHSILVECKASRADFLADQMKFSRRNPQFGIGTRRYYMAELGLLSETELPAGWGLLELTARGVCVTRKSEYFRDCNGRHEISILLSALRRVGHNAPRTVSIKCYTIESGNTATLGLADETAGEFDL